MVLGASVAEATLGKKVGNKAVLWGAIGATIPDLDVIPGQFLDTVARLSLHRGPTHSILFGLLLSPVLGWLIAKIHRNEDARSWDWTKLIFWVILTHALLDCFTTWGTQLFWPLEYRVAIKSIFVIDPVYTLPFLACLVWVMFKKRGSNYRRNLNAIGLTISSLYLAVTLLNKQVMNDNFEAILKTQNISYLRYNTRPTPLNNILWSVTAETESGYYLGYYSFLDRSKNVPLFFIPKNHDLLSGWRTNDKVKTLLGITSGYYTVEPLEDGYLINDLRFGQTDGWSTGTGDFVFAYYVTNTEANDHEAIEITQRPNSVRVGTQMLKQFWERIKGV